MSRLPIKPVIVDADESATLKIKLTDHDTGSLSKNSIQTLSLRVLTGDGEVVNGRDWQDIKDVNGGTIDDDGTCWVTLSELDNAFVTDTEKYYEIHIVAVRWTFNDLSGNPGTGIEPVEIQIRRLPG